MPVIRHKSGPLAGKEQTIDNSVNRITFGRDPAACDVVYPADSTIVARRHFALVRTPAGEWTFEDFGKPYVGINGAPAEVAQAVDSGDVVELGQPGGPSFEFISGGKNLGSELPSTIANYQPESARTTSARARRMALLAGLVAIVGAGAAATYSYWTGQQGAGLGDKIAALTKAQEEQAKAAISPAVRDKLIQSAHLVATRLPSGQMLAGGGTAFPIAPDTFGTNAHVAEAFAELKDGQKLIVRAPGQDGKVYEVTSVEIHPGWKAFQQYQQEDPIFVTTSRNCPQCMPLRLEAPLSYDVAILRVAPGSNIGPMVEIAAREELQKLAVGSPIGTAGYPVEQVRNRNIAGVVATPNFRTGIVNAMSDMFYMPGDPAQRNIITHNIPITGGASGSAILGADGKLVGLINAMSIYVQRDGERQQRMPSAAIINYAQRADLLLDIVEGKAEAKLKADRDYWNKQTVNFARGQEYVIPRLLEEIRSEVNATPQPAAEFKGTLTSADSYKVKDDDGKEVTRRQKIHSIVLKNQPGVIIGYAKGKALSVYAVSKEGKILAKAEGTWIPNIRYPAQSTELNLDIYVVSADADTEYTLVHYTWTGGST